MSPIGDPNTHTSRVQISRLLHAHELVLGEAGVMARGAAATGDEGTDDLLVSDVIRLNEMQVWFVAKNIVETPCVHALGAMSIVHVVLVANIHGPDP